MSEAETRIEREGWQHPSVQPIPVANPAAGAAAVYSPPGSEVTLVRSVYAQLVTSSQAASRVPTLTFSYGDGSPYAIFQSGFTIAASKTVKITWGVGLQNIGTNDGPYITIPIPEYRLPVGSKLTVTADALDAADQFSVVHFAVEQWPVRP